MAADSEASWPVVFCSEFVEEFKHLDLKVRKKIMAYIGLLGKEGPNLGRPYVDTLHGSALSNLKELRCPVDREEWRVLFVFDASRQAVILVAGDKKGRNQKGFYRKTMALAEQRYQCFVAGKGS